MARAGLTVERRIASCSDMPRAISLEMQLGISTAGKRTLSGCRSVLMVSGTKPRRMARAATGQRKVPPPCPRSNKTPRRARFEHVILNFAVETIEQLELAVVIKMRVYIAGTKDIQNFFSRAATGAGQDMVVHQDRRIR